MNGKKTQTPLASTYVTRLKKLIKTELGTVFLTTDNKRHLNEYTALMHESCLEDKREQDRRCETMKTNIAELICEVLKNKKWGIFFKNEPMQSLPIQDNTTMFKVNEVKEDELVDAIKQAVAERVNEWQNHQTGQNQNDNESLNGTNQTLSDTRE
jgi:molybdopterin converting factor small subunit